MPYLINIFLYAISDIILPVFTLEVIADRKVKFNTFIFIVFFCILTSLRMFSNLNYFIIELCIYLGLIYHLKMKDEILYYVGFFILTNLLLMPIINILYYFLFNGFIDYSFSFSELFANEHLEFICKMLYLIILFYMQNYKIKEKNVFEKKYWNYLYIFFIMCLMFIIIFSTLSYTFNQNQYSILFSLLSGITILLLYILNNFFKSLHDIVIDKHNLMIQHEKSKIELNTLLESQESMIQLKKFKHDIQNNFVILKYMIEEKEYTSVTKYLNNYIKEYEELQSRFIQIENIIVSAIVNDKLKRYPNLKFFVKCFIPKKLSISDLDLVTILGNILDNACEYVDRMKLDGVIECKITCNYESTLFFEVKNPCIEPKLTPETFKTSKIDKNAHGYGIMNVKRAVNNNDGIYDVKIKDGYFITQVLIPEGGALDADN